MKAPCTCASVDGGLFVSLHVCIYSGLTGVMGLIIELTPMFMKYRWIKELWFDSFMILSTRRPLTVKGTVTHQSADDTTSVSAAARTNQNRQRSIPIKRADVGASHSHLRTRLNNRSWSHLTRRTQSWATTAQVFVICTTSTKQRRCINFFKKFWTVRNFSLLWKCCQLICLSACLRQ